MVKAKPLFPGHYQPHLPADLGFYDLRVPEVRWAQAEMAREYGITGFCYWHYWFAGRQILERPFSEVLESGEPDFPFCLGWANDSWTGVWHGTPDRMLIEQTYPGTRDYVDHFYAVLPAFQDSRYLTIDGKKVFMVFRPYQLPDPRAFTDCWRELSAKEGLAGLYLIGISWKGWDPDQYGFDAYLDHPPLSIVESLPSPVDRVSTRLFKHDSRYLLNRLLSLPRIYSYHQFARQALLQTDFEDKQYPCLVPNWDNTPRSSRRGLVLHNATPELFGAMVKHAVKRISLRKPDRRVIFIKSWNEWAEGNHLEPDVRFGKRYLEIIKQQLDGQFVP